MVSNFGSTFRAFVEIEGVLNETELAEGMFAAGGDGVNQVILAKETKNSDIADRLLGGFLFLFFFNFFGDVMNFFSVLDWWIDFYFFLHKFIVQRKVRCPKLLFINVVQILNIIYSHTFESALPFYNSVLKVQIDI